jgi:hypothetical protein
MIARQRSMPRACAGAALLLACAAAMPAAAQARDDLWEISTKMEMPGMPMAMPPQTNRICIGKNRRDEDFIPKQGNCRMLDSSRAGNRFTYRMECTGDHAGTVDGAINFGNNAYDGQMRLAMKDMNAAMTMTFNGKRVGDCTAK